MHFQLEYYKTNSLLDFNYIIPVANININFNKKDIEIFNLNENDLNEKKIDFNLKKKNLNFI